MQLRTGQTEGLKATGLEATALAGAAVGANSQTEERLAGIERARVEAVVETLADLRGGGESLAEVAHDARNMVTALGLYCDLLEEPGVLTTPFLHYASELRLVATASRRLVEKLMAIDFRLGPAADRFSAARFSVEPPQQDRARPWELMPAEPIDNLAAEVLASRDLLAALAGPAFSVTADIQGGALPIQITREDLTRILVNLVKNAAEAMPEGGRIQVGLHEHSTAGKATQTLLLTVEDNGPGIPSKFLEKVFESGYSTRANTSKRGGWQASHRGLGLSIVRSIVEAAGGRVHATNRSACGARVEIELPVRAC